MTTRTEFTFELRSVDVAQIPLTIAGQLDAFDEVVEALVEVDRVQSIESWFYNKWFATSLPNNLDPLDQYFGSQWTHQWFD